MSDVKPLIDQEARERFRTEWHRNFAVSANAGSGKTTAISERLAAMALAPTGAELLGKTAVVTFTKKAAAQIGQRARAVLLKRVGETGGKDLAPLDHLERAFFGTIHSFCLKLAQTYGQTLGINLNPEVVGDDNDETLWEAFIEQDSMQFSALPAGQLAAFLRHVPLEDVFALARQLDDATARRFLKQVPGRAAGPAQAVLKEILAVVPKQKSSLPKVAANQRAAEEWLRAWQDEKRYLPLIDPEGTAAGMDVLFDRFFAPLKDWLAKAGSVLAAELAGRFRAWRFERGVQTYADQIDAAMAVLRDREILERIRAEGWRIILDEAQDTDPQQFAVLVEITRPPGAPLGAWPGLPNALGPRAGHFCLVGDGQQAIYGSRADIRNFRRHTEAFARGEGGELLNFKVTFRAPHAVVRLLNATLPEAFGEGRAHSFGLPVEEGAPAPMLQVPYENLEAGPGNVEGVAMRLPLVMPVSASGVDAWQSEEIRQVAAFFNEHGPAGVGARCWGDVCVIAPRNGWLLEARKGFEAAGLEVALQTRRNRNGDNPAYAWLAGLLAVICDPDNAFEWVGVLREIFGVSDALLAVERKREGGANEAFNWAEPEAHPEPLRGALEVLRPFILSAQDEGVTLERFAADLVKATRLEERTWLVDPSGGVTGELERLLAQAAELGLEGAGPRDWWHELAAHLDDGRPAGKPTEDAINLLTAHSAKGLEWPVVVVLGLWREPGTVTARGLRLIPDSTGAMNVFYDGASVPADTKEARERERLRELVRLLYVTLTRPRQVLVIPWVEGFGGKVKPGSFSTLWGAKLHEVDELAKTAALATPESEGESVKNSSINKRIADTQKEQGPELPLGAEAPVLPRRVLPHQLAHKPDLTRIARHESGADEPVSARALADDAIDYGLWWHETLEFMPWVGNAVDIAAHGATRLAAAEAQGFGERAAVEWQRWLESEARKELSDARWTRQAELAVFAPLDKITWMDGVIDLVLHDEAAGKVWVLDWKTNRRRKNESDDDMLARLAREYEPQLSAYGTSVQAFFPGCEVRLLVYSTGVGKWIETPRG
ncbi:UvrD-helicase domain-containing protein [Rariglobus hedericola]|nr:UvrD-helicase domain-containing protein [Rariglobus hedericola]